MDNQPGASPPRQFISLRVKIVVTAVSVLLAGLVAGTMLANDFVTGEIMKHVEHESETTAQFVRDGIRTAMLRGDTDEVRDIIDGLGKNPKINGITLTNYEGIVVATSGGDGLGAVKGEYPDSADHVSSLPQGSTSGPVSHSLRIDNAPECAGCHGGEGPVLGWLTVDMSVEDTLAQIGHIKKAIAAAGGVMLLVLAVTISFVMTLLVSKPVEKLAATMKAAEDDLTVRARTESNDEVGLLSESFNSLLGRLQGARDEADRVHVDELARYSSELEHANSALDDKVKKLSALSVIGRNMNEIRKLDDLIKLVLNTALHELDGGSGSVMLYERAVGELFIHYGKGLAPEGQRKARFRLGEGIAGWVAENKKSVSAPRAIEDPRYVPGKGLRHDMPVICVPFIGTSGNLLGVINVERKEGLGPFSQSDMEYLTAMAGQAAVAIENVELIQNLQKSYYDTISALAMTVEAKDPYTLGHSKRVTQYAMAIADEMGLSERDLQTIQYGATLHDIGKIGVRESVLNKPGVLTSEEFTEIMDHAVIGEKIISGVDFLQATRPIIRNHQERFDGKGYPDGLRGREIPPMVAIVSVADNFDALTTDRPYRKAFSAARTIEMIKEDAGTKFDPEVVEAFMRIFGE